jgi:hypothetical protein
MPESHVDLVHGELLIRLAKPLLLQVLKWVRYQSEYKQKCVWLQQKLHHLVCQRDNVSQPANRATQPVHVYMQPHDHQSDDTSCATCADDVGVPVQLI